MLNIKELQQQALNRIENILDRLKIEWAMRSSERINIICPVHKSNDLSSSCIYLSNGNYKCWSKGCDSEIGYNFIHLIKWYLSQDSEESVTWEDVKSFVDSEQITEVREITKTISHEITYMDPAKYPSVNIPCKYYIDRGFSPETLTKFHIGLTEQFPYAGRSIVPIKCPNGKLMGFSGRSIYPKCPKCKYYHSKYQTCISDDYEYAHMFNKWFHSSGMKKTLTLYNIDNISGQTKLAIVEGPSCVWRLDMFGIPAVAVLGRTFGNHQAQLLKSKGVSKIFLLSDQDEPGQLFKRKFIEEWHTVFQIYVTTLPKKDISEMSDEEIKSIIIPKWNKI
jgi:5S rRNA maturation endonuclease (ribonuclease M5)